MSNKGARYKRTAKVRAKHSANAKKQWGSWQSRKIVNSVLKTIKTNPGLSMKQVLYQDVDKILDDFDKAVNQLTDLISGANEQANV